MGQIQNVGKPGITVTPIDRETGPGAGPGTSGNRDIYLGQGSATNSTLNDSIVLGNNAGSAGMADAQLDGSIIVGSGAATSITSGPNGAALNNSNIVIGFEAMASLVAGRGMIVIGHRAAFAAVRAPNQANNDSVIIGSFANEFAEGVNAASVIIGARAARGGAVPGNVRGANGCVIIGSDAASNANAASLTGCIVIGFQAANALGSGSSTTLNHVIIGTSAAASLQNGGDIVMIGASIACRTQTVFATGVGSTATVDDSGVSIGYLAGGFAGGGGRPGLGCICIGSGAGGQLSNASPWQLIIESFDQTGFVRHAGIYGDLLNGNIVLGGSQIANGRDFGSGATNAIKILPGTTGGAPANGGYFYYDGVTGLHFIGASGTDTVLAPP